MKAKHEISVGREILEKILSAFPPESPHWNEAQNRFKFIDRLFLECLGWEHPNINVEVRDNAGEWSDYHLGAPVRAILEAKRESVVFDIFPVGKPNSARTLRSLTECCPALNKVVNQVIPYCAMSGAQLAIACNGPSS